MTTQADKQREAIDRLESKLEDVPHSERVKLTAKHMSSARDVLQPSRDVHPVGAFGDNLKGILSLPAE
jgi:hypothetical protein